MAQLSNYMPDTQKHEYFTDHDLLVRLDERTRTQGEELRGLRDTIKDDIHELKKSKLDVKEFHTYREQRAAERTEKISDYDRTFERAFGAIAVNSKKTDKLFRAYYTTLGVVGVLEFAIPFLLKHYNLI